MDHIIDDDLRTELAGYPTEYHLAQVMFPRKVTDIWDKSLTDVDNRRAQIAEIDRRMEIYLQWCIIHDTLMSRAGMRIVLGCSKEAICSWARGESKSGDQVVAEDVAEVYADRMHVIKKWYDVAEAGAVRMSSSGDKVRTTGAIFNLKSEHGHRETDVPDAANVLITGLEALLMAARDRKAAHGNTIDVTPRLPDR